MGCPLYPGTIQRRLRDPEERHAIEIEGSLIEIPGGIDTATMTEDEDVTMATGQGDELAQDEMTAAYLEALEDGRMDWCDIEASDQAKIRRLSAQRTLRRLAEKWRQEEPTADRGAGGQEGKTNNTQEQECVDNNKQERGNNNTQEGVAKNTQEGVANNTQECVANNTQKSVATNAQE